MKFEISQTMGNFEESPHKDAFLENGKWIIDIKSIDIFEDISKIDDVNMIVVNYDNNPYPQVLLYNGYWE